MTEAESARVFYCREIRKEVLSATLSLSVFLCNLSSYQAQGQLCRAVSVDSV
jgi:hypothetical protein